MSEASTEPRAGERRGDRDKSRARGEIEHAFPSKGLAMVEHVAGERLTAGPCEGPERRRQAHFAEFLLGLLPDRHRLVGEPEPEFGNERRGEQPGVGENERAEKGARRS